MIGFSVERVYGMMYGNRATKDVLRRNIMGCPTPGRMIRSMGLGRGLGRGRGRGPRGVPYRERFEECD